MPYYPLHASISQVAIFCHVIKYPDFFHATTNSQGIIYVIISSISPIDNLLVKNYMYLKVLSIPLQSFTKPCTKFSDCGFKVSGVQSL